MEYREIYLSFVILVNTAVFLLHSLVHFEVQVFPGLLDTVFIVLVIGIAPLVSMLAIFMRTQFYGGLLLFFSLLVSLIYGVYHHFLAAGSDNAFSMPNAPWPVVFFVTSLLLLVTEMVGMWVAGILVYRSLEMPSSAVSQDAQ